jgi:hypothetical protein
MLGLMLLLSVLAAPQGKAEDTLLSCLFNEARVAQSLRLTAEQFETQLQSACAEEEATYKVKALERLLAQGRSQPASEADARNAVLQQKRAIMSIYRARTSKD